MMFLKALLALLFLPGTVSGLIPALIINFDPWRSEGLAICLLFSALGLSILLSCVWTFYKKGKGTLAPWSPPKGLMVTGLYRYMRNPMYVGISLIIIGLAIFFGSPLLIGYLALVVSAFNLRVIFAEEPWLNRQFEAEWKLYSSQVSRWIPRFPRN